MSSSDWDGRAGTQLISKKDHPILQTATVLIRHSEDFPVEVLDDEGNHEILGRVLLRKDEEDGGFLRRKHFSVNGTVEAQDLLQLTIKERIEPGQHRGHD